MSASNVNNVAAPRQVACQTADVIQVDLDALRLSRSFKKMYDDLGLEEHDEFPGVFPVWTVSTRTFNKVIDWCKEHKDDPEPVVEKDPLTQECKRFEWSEFELHFFDILMPQLFGLALVPIPELLELVIAADNLDIPGLYHHACQAVAACIKRRRGAREICILLQQDCDLDYAQVCETLNGNPWLNPDEPFLGASIENNIFIPNEVLLTIFQKLPRKALERLQLVSTQFHDVIVNSVELSEHQGPLRVVTVVEFGTYSYDRSTQKIDIWLADGTKATCEDYENLSKRLKFAVVQKLQLNAWYRGLYYAAIQDLSPLLPAKHTWKDSTVEASSQCFYSKTVFEFAFTHLFLCNEIVLRGEAQSFSWSRPHMRLPAVVACNKLDVSRLSLYGTLPEDIVEWLEHEVPPEKKLSEPRQLIINESGVDGGTDGLLTALKAAFSATSSRKPYVVRILRGGRRDNVAEVLSNETTQETLSICIGQNREVIVERT